MGMRKGKLKPNHEFKDLLNYQFKLYEHTLFEGRLLMQLLQRHFIEYFSN